MDIADFIVTMACGICVVLWSLFWEYSDDCTRTIETVDIIST